MRNGGIRIIYYLVHRDEVFMLYAYAKNKREDLTTDQVKRLRSLVDLHLDL